MVTNGYEQNNKNNQPVAKNGIIGIHNGIIVNDSDLWKKYSDETKFSDLDSEIIPTLISRFEKEGASIIESIRKLYKEIKGIANIAFYHSSVRGIILSTNNGSIYFINCSKTKLFFFASERFILNRLIDDCNLSLKKSNIKQLLPKQILLVQGEGNPFVIKEGDNFKILNINNYKKPFLNFSEIKSENQNKLYYNNSLDHSFSSVSKKIEDYHSRRVSSILF